MKSRALKICTDIQSEVRMAFALIDPEERNPRSCQLEILFFTGEFCQIGPTRRGANAESVLGGKS